MQESYGDLRQPSCLGHQIGCLLCAGTADQYPEGSDRYYRCRECSVVFLDPALRLSKTQERLRYEQHNNDVDDPRYQKFVEPVIQSVERQFLPLSQGLDFGSGTGPVLTKLLRERGYAMEMYDPFFANDPAVLQRRYDFIVCCEVIEHFRDPAQEFYLLRGLLRPGGVLVCKTEILRDEIDFSTWYYQRDPTHIIFYPPATLEWIRKKYEFSRLRMDGRLIEFFA